jgi:hypothetical protein
VDNVVAQVKKEKIYNKITGGYEDPSEKLMSDVEKILNISGPVERHREAMLGRIAAYKIDHPNDDIQVGQVFHDYLTALQDHYYRERQKLVNHNFMVMLSLDTDNEKNYKDDEIELARTTFANLDKRFGYDRDSAIECLKFIMSYRPNRPT